MEADPDLVKRHFQEQITHRVREWMELAAERLDGSGVPVYLMPGNDDDFEIDPILAESTYCRNVNEQVVDLTPWHQLVSMGWSSPTPWSTPRELPEEEFLDRLSGLMRGVRDPRRTVIMTHVPPYDSGLDTAPLLSPDLRPTVSAGDLLRGPVGSTGVRTRDRDVQAGPRRARPHPRVGRRAPDRGDGLRQRRVRGVDGHPARLPHRPDRARRGADTPGGGLTPTTGAGSSSRQRAPSPRRDPSEVLTPGGDWQATGGRPASPRPHGGRLAPRR